MAATAKSPLKLALASLLGLAAALGLLAGLDPRYALAAALGLAFVAIVISDLAVGVCLFAVASFLDVLPFGGSLTSLSKVIGLLLLVSWVAVLGTQGTSGRDFFAAHPTMTYVLVLFLAWSTASALWAEDGSAALSDLQRYAPNALLFLIVFTAIRERRQAIWLGVAFIGGTLISVLYGLANPAPAGAVNDVSRLSGVGFDPNELAALAVAGMVLTVPFALEWRRSPGVRVLAVGAATLCLASVLLSFSRGGLVALAVMLVAAVIAGGRWRVATVAILIVVVIGGAGYFAGIATPEQRARVTEANGGTGRSDIWAVGWRMFAAHPVRGVGSGNFPISSVHYLLRPGSIQRSDFIVDKPKVAHNIYLQEAAELGIPGFAMFMTIVGFALACAVRAARCFRDGGDRQMELFSRAVFLALVGLMAAFFFLSEQFSKQLWLLMAFAPALLAVSEMQLRRRQSTDLSDAVR